MIILYTNMQIKKEHFVPGKKKHSKSLNLQKHITIMGVAMLVITMQLSIEQLFFE